MDKFILLILFIKFICAQNSIKLLFITDETQLHVSEYTGKILKELEDMTHHRLKLDDQFLTISNNPEENDQKFCSIIANGVNMVIDLSVSEFYDNTVMSKIIAFRLPYVKLDISINAFVEAFDQYMMKRNATDAAMIFSTSTDLEQTVSFLIGNSILRVIVLDGNDSNSLKRLADIRPSPSYYAIFADTTEQMINVYDNAQKYNLIYRFDRWNLVFLDFNHEEFINKKIENDELNISISIIYPKAATACYVQMRELPCDIPNNFNLMEELLRSFLKLLTNIILKDEDKYNLLTIDCNADNIIYDNETEMFFRSAIADEIGSTNDKFYFDEVNSVIRLKYEIGIKVLNDSYELTSIAQWTKNEGITVNSDQEIIPTKAFYRIGTAEAIPWSFPERDPSTGESVLDENGKPKWTGYCLDLIDLLSQEMNFDYELVIPENGTFGKRIGPDKWDGLIGDLKTGKTDIAVAALTMTAEREEVIDFVAPYFEQTGILVVMRKPVRQTSMFKFMTVLKMEVWLSILAALIVTAVLLWILDTFSPYSARNNKKAYPYPCREFTLKESFWFALTSFTPQGGGEAPKSVSGRTLVAAYWLFVVLMLATFTANLAAFLTVERMQTPVQSMEQLARQSRINYTVMEGSPTHEYFTNMKFAEETLYRLWKELTLNATSDQSQYRVWDYPIKEQYGHILSAIQETGTVENETVGFQKVLDHDEADFAFIHDSSRIKYEVSRNCNLTTIGELFAEQPFAIAVQQGSHLQEEISKVLLDMQKNRVFEHLTNKYWNYSARGVCSDDSDSEGISLESLGGVFIATLFGLALAMITLAVEVIYYKRKEKLEVRAILEDSKKPKAQKSPKIVTIGTTFKPVTDKIPRVSHISVFPRHNFNP